MCMWCVCLCFVSLFPRVFWLWFRRGLFSACEEVQEEEDVFGSSSSCLWLPCRRGHYLGRVLCVRMCLLLVMAQLELCVCLQEQLTPLLLHVKLLGGSLPPWVCVWEWWKLCLMPFTLYFWEIYASGWVGWPWGVMARWWAKLWGEIQRGSLIKIGFDVFWVFFLNLKESQKPRRHAGLLQVQ